MRGTKKLQNIEFLRFLFTLCICIHHFLYVNGMHFKGYLAVEFFFILSGFLLVYTFNDQRTVADFIKSKIVRFVPLLFTSAFLYGYCSSHLSFDGVVSNVLFLPFPGLKYDTGYPDISWYIAVLFWGLLFYFCIMKYWRREVGCFIISIIIFFSYVCLMATTWNRLANVNVFLNVNLLRGLGGIGIGYLLATYVLNKPVRILPKSYMYSLLEFIFLLFCVVGLFSRTIYPNNPLYLVLSFAVLLYLFIIKKGVISQYLDRFSWNNISKYTLAIYLGQDVIIFCFYRTFLNLDLVKGSFLEVMLIVILSCCIFGVWLYWIVEKPCGVLLKKFLDGKYVSKK